MDVHPKHAKQSSPINYESWALPQLLPSYTVRATCSGCPGHMSGLGHMFGVRAKVLGVRVGGTKMTVFGGTKMTPLPSYTLRSDIIMYYLLSRSHPLSHEGLGFVPG